MFLKKRECHIFRTSVTNLHHIILLMWSISATCIQDDTQARHFFPRLPPITPDLRRDQEFLQIFGAAFDCSRLGISVWGSSNEIKALFDALARRCKPEQPNLGIQANMRNEIALKLLIQQPLNGNPLNSNGASLAPEQAAHWSNDRGNLI